MDLKSWEEVRRAIEDEHQEILLYYKEEEEWWVSRLYGEEKSFLLTRSKDSYTQKFASAQELFNNGIVDGKPFIKRIKNFY